MILVQMSGVPGAAPGGDETLVFQEWIHNMKRPDAGYLRLDTSRPVDVCVREAIAFVDGRSG